MRRFLNQIHSFDRGALSKKGLYFTYLLSTPAAAIDRLVHYSIILEVIGPSYRNEKAKEGKINDDKDHGHCENYENVTRKDDVKL